MHKENVWFGGVKYARENLDLGKGPQRLDSSIDEAGYIFQGMQ